MLIISSKGTTISTKPHQLLGVVRLSGVARGRPDPRVLHSQELLRGQVLLVAVAPQLIPDLKGERVFSLSGNL